MQPLTLRPGDAVFRRGDPSDAVYVIDRGEIVIRTGESEIDVVLLGDGDLFGEAGVLENRPRSASAYALTPTTLLKTDAEPFLKAFGIDNDRALSLLKLLCHRLREMTRRATRAESELHLVDPDAPAGAPSRLRLVPDGERLRRLIGGEPVEIHHLPFQVGNRYGGETSPISSATRYCIPARADAELAAPHFEILRHEQELVLRDLSIGIGTVLNGQRLTHHGHEAVGAIRQGDNTVVAGGVDSPFRFRLIWEPPSSR